MKRILYVLYLPVLIIYLLLPFFSLTRCSYYILTIALFFICRFRRPKMRVHLLSLPNFRNSWLMVNVSLMKQNELTCSFGEITRHAYPASFQNLLQPKSIVVLNWQCISLRTRNPKPARPQLLRAIVHLLPAPAFHQIQCTPKKQLKYQKPSLKWKVSEIINNSEHLLFVHLLLV